MSSGWFLTRIAEAALLPPLSLLILLALGAWLARRRRRLGLAVGALAWCALLVLSLPVVGTGLKRSLEGPPLDPARAAGAQAIVVLGGGVRAAAPQYGRDAVNAVTLDRLRYAAHLSRLYNKPILATGGDPTGRHVPEGVAMKFSLATDLGVDTRWTETASNTTDENAINSYALLAPLGIDRILLVTDGWHMRRSRLAFERAGFAVTEAPSNSSESAIPALAWLPSAGALCDSGLALREWLGLAWYRLKFALR